MSDPRLAMARKYRGAGLGEEAWGVLSDLLAGSSPPAEAFELAAAIRFEAGDISGALALCDRAIAADPTRDQAHVERALALDAAGRLDDAKIAFRAALELNPSHADAWVSLGLVLERLGQPDEAMVALHRAIQLRPNFLIARNNLGAVLAGQGQFAAAAREFATVLDIAPDNAAAATNLAASEIERGQARTGYHRLVQLPPSAARNDNMLFSLHNFTSDPAALAAQHAVYCGPLAPQRVPANSGRPLRVGYVSGDFRRHSVAYFFEPLLRHHDTAAVHVTCYANVATPDSVTARLRAHAGTWRDIRGVAADRVVEMIHADRIDVLVDLAGRTQDHRLDVFAQRPAPVQITGIGYPGTTGLRVFDGRIADAVTDPPEDDRYSSEPVLRLATGMHCYRPPDDAPAPQARTGGDVVFGSFNKLAKLSDETVALWARVLDAVPDAKLLIKAKALVEATTCSDVIERFARCGITAERLILSGWRPVDRDHLAAYHQVDIALDTFPYNGTTTTCEALWMGVPVVTLKGRTHASRVGASLLGTVGLADWVAADDQEFADRAAAAARDRAGRADLRRMLRGRMAASPLCDGALYARTVEAEYQRLSLARSR